MGLRRAHPAVLAHDPRLDGALRVADAVERERIKVVGQVVRIRSRPAQGLPSIAVTISDESGSITAVWTGRRAIGGVTLGRRLIIEGVGRRVGQQLELTNPAYTLLT